MLLPALPWNNAIRSHAQKVPFLSRFLVWIRVLCIVWLSACLLSVLWAASWSGVSYYYLKQQTLAPRPLFLAKTGTTILNTLTLKRIGDIILWHQLVTIAQTIAIHEASLTDAIRNFEQTNTLPTQTIQIITQEIEPALQAIASLDAADDRANDSAKKAKIIPSQALRLCQKKLNCQQLQTMLPEAIQILQLIKQTLRESGTYLLFLQNSDEIRATGGFLGSYARFEMTPDTISYQGIHDIYETAGQTNRMLLPADFQTPAAVAQYLSGGEGIQLPDANWSADFATSAETILELLHASDQKSVVAIAAINTELIKSLLQLTGPLVLPDYNTIVTAETVTEQARANRADFFPGSKQKVAFLDHLATQIKLELAANPPKNSAHWLAFYNQMKQQKQLQIYHTDPTIQSNLEAVQLAGQIIPQSAIAPASNQHIIFPIESNVGINKANAAVSRAYALHVTPQKIMLRITFTNHNKPGSATLHQNPHLAVADHLHYVNYQRFLISPELEVHSILQDDTEIPNWDEISDTQSSATQSMETTNQALTEVGFLMTVTEGDTSEILLILEPTYQLTSADVFTIPFQAGIPVSPFVFNQAGFSQTTINPTETVKLQTTPFVSDIYSIETQRASDLHFEVL